MTSSTGFMRQLKVSGKAYTLTHPQEGSFHVVFRERFVHVSRGRRRRMFGPLNGVQRPGESMAKIAVTWFLLEH